MTNGMPLGAYWGARGETVESCVVRVDAWLERLAALDLRFTSWRLTADRPDAARAFPSGDALADVMRRLRGASDGDVVPDDAGYLVSGWNASELSFNLRIGESSPALGNAVVLRLPDALVPDITADAAVEMVAATARAFEPRTSVLVDRAAARAQAPRISDPCVGRLTYVAERVPELDGVEQVPVGPGTIIVAGRDWSHVRVEQLVALRDRLQANGVDLRRSREGLAT